MKRYRKIINGHHLLSPIQRPHQSTRRGLFDADIALFCRVVKDNPRKTVRVYSDMGFVPNAYRYRCEIQWIQRDKDGKINIGWSGAQRRFGRAAHVTVNNRGYPCDLRYYDAVTEDLKDG